MLNMLLFFYAPVMLGAFLWNIIACLCVFRRRQVVSWRFRYAHYLVMLLMLPGLVCDVGTMFSDSASLLWAAWLYPAAFFLATSANLGSLRRGGFRWWLVPVPLRNLLLGLIILTADYPEASATQPPSTREDVLATMRPFQQFLAARYRPDILVPFIEPYGAFIVLSRTTYTPAEWEDLLAAATKAVHDASPGVRCAV